MISFINRLVFDFENSHGCRPNTLYLNCEHLDRLQDDFEAGTDIQAIARLLEMEIIISREAVHPHVVRVSTVNDIQQAC
ncbi:MAG: hypothetical protein BMS9Abin26_2077 [Gammaproteobacteria bacterium]|nr:MAG: hypothetical protein BMS9Abin26_2077 [Gammaproteobacteria bacterium]